MKKLIRSFDSLAISDIPEVGGKNASLGEMIHELSAQGIRVPNGFATTATAFRDFIAANELAAPLAAMLEGLDREGFANLGMIGQHCRGRILAGKFSPEFEAAITEAYRVLSNGRDDLPVAVRSSATAEDLPDASFAGQQETYLNVRGPEAVIAACKRCFASLYTDRAIAYREEKGFAHAEVALSVGVQEMVDASAGASGVAFTIDPDSGFDKVVVINGVWGLGENIVQGTVDPDEFVVYKPALKAAKRALLRRELGAKQMTMRFSDAEGENVENVKTPDEARARFVLEDAEVAALAHWCNLIEAHYGRPMDIEWAKDGATGDLHILQARPETVFAQRKPHEIHRYRLSETGTLLTSGIRLGNKIAAGKARILRSPAEAHLLQPGEVLVTDVTNPDWDPIMKKAAAIVTNKGGRTSHAAIVARELGVVAVVGTGDATQVIADGQEITVSCAGDGEGQIFDGLLAWETENIDTRTLKLPSTEIKMILGDPAKAFGLSFLPNNGIGLMRLEFVINNAIGIHPMALVEYESLEDVKVKTEIGRRTAFYKAPSEFFIDRLAMAVGTIAAAFYPREVIVRMSDFKSNEYANLLGGHLYEPPEENPMIGFRGASRYYSAHYREGFRLECAAMRRVREEMGLDNVKLMIPFCRTLAEGRKVLALMEAYGLKRGQNGLEIYVMVELPSNVILARDFAQIFDGFSIGSNDLTQFTLGIDRDSRLISDLFDEENPAVKAMVAMAIRIAKESGTPIGLCGQGPSDSADFARFLVEHGIDSISFTPDALIAGLKQVWEAEQSLIRS